MLETATLLVLAILSLVFPLFRLPPPSGPLPVGTMTLPIDQPGGLAMQLWYPAAPAPGAAPAPYRPAGAGVRVAVLRHVRTAAIEGAALPAGSSRYPVLVFVNGWNGSRWEATALLQDLASHGFIVASSDQPRGIVDGVDLDARMDLSSAAAYQRTLQLAAAKLVVQVRTARAVLDRLAGLDSDPSSRFHGRLNLQQAGILGFSFGGATAAEAAVDDPRFRAAVNLDGLLFGEAARTGVPVPYLEFTDESTLPDNAAQSPDPAVRTLAAIYANEWQRIDRVMPRHGGTLITVHGALHANFADGPLFQPFRRFTNAGRIDPVLAQRLVSRWTVAFFRHVFAGDRLPDPADFPQLAVQTWPPPTAPVTPAAASAAAIRSAVPQ